MAADEEPENPGGPLVGVVLGAGGVLGAAWMVGALVAVQERLGFGVGEAGLLLGTSAGSVLAAALRCGVTVEEMLAHQRGGLAGGLMDLGPPDLGGRALPPPPLLRVGSPRLMLAALRAPHRVHPWVAASALLPQGRARHVALHSMVQAMASHAWPHLPPHEDLDAGQPGGPFAGSRAGQVRVPAVDAVTGSTGVAAAAVSDFAAAAGPRAARGAASAGTPGAAMAGAAMAGAAMAGAAGAAGVGTE
ncbi:MAG TPA: hypothetical protein VKD26_00335, partial [Streptosporangiaceae bacterium]|nr:hypothetical protein [Streptosporangiaceae bacterium]